MYKILYLHYISVLVDSVMVCIMFQIMLASIQNIYDKEIVLLSYFNALFIICLHPAMRKQPDTQSYQSDIQDLIVITKILHSIRV